VSIRARAPGKMVALGEYAVLEGAPALVLAVDRYAAATIAPSEDALSHLKTLFPDPTEREFPPGEPSGSELVDVVTSAGAHAGAWSAFSIPPHSSTVGTKLGIGSSAAALCAWAGRGPPMLDERAWGSWS
jgi:mevalonate kinase